MKNECRKNLAIALCFMLICGQFPLPASALSFYDVAQSHDPHFISNSASVAANELRNLIRRAYPLEEFEHRGPESPARKLRASRSRRRTLPAQADAPSQSANLPGQSSTLLSNGDLLLLGGETKDGPVTAAFIKESSSGRATELPNGLLHARAYHTATVLPDGSVLVFGGTTQGNEIEKSAEIFDPSSLKFSELPTAGLMPRSYHSATVLTDGRVLIAGGISSDGEVLEKIEFWDPRSQAVSASAVAMLVPHEGHTATLQADGSVLFWGGSDKYGEPFRYGEVFDPSTQTERIEASRPQDSGLSPLVEASIPQAGEQSVPLDTLISVRFSKPLQVQALNVNTVVLSGPDNNLIVVKVIPAEAGMLVFVTPQSALLSGTQYSLSISGATDSAGQILPVATIAFTTAGQAASGVAGAGGAGSSDDGNPFDSSWRKLPPLQAPPGVTAVAGQVLQLNGEPLNKVTLQIGNLSVHSDATGRFLIENVPSGHQVMWIDATSANTKNSTYGLYEVGVDITAGQTNVLSYTIWMTELDTAHAVTIPSPTQSETVITTPSLPGLELHIPPHTTILDRNSQPVTKISITPIPVKQPPFPLPKDVLVPTYFTIQPGGAYVQVADSNGPKGAQLYYPNTYHYPAGVVFNFYDYDADEKGWYVYGQGRVSADKSQVVPNPGVTIYEFTGAMVSQPSNAPPNGPKQGNPKRGEPVDLQTGLFVYSKTDLVLPDVIPLVLTRTYRQNDFISRPFGIGTNDSFDFFMVGDNASFPEGYTYQDLILPDGGRVHFPRTSPCNGACSYTDAVYTAVPAGTDFDGATIRWASGGFPGASYLLTKKDGTTYGFPDSYASTVPQAAAPVGMSDRYGNTVTFTRDSNHNLTQMTSPNGRWIQFTYDTSNRITKAQDNIGRAAKYTYDSGGRLWTVTDLNGGVTTFTYDSNNNMLTIQDARQILYLTNYYDSNNRVYKQVQADNGTFLFSYTLDSNSNVTQTNVTDPRENVEQVMFNSDGYVTSGTFAVGKPEQQTFTYARQPGSGLLLSVTDPLNRQTAYSYDGVGNLTSVTKLAGTQNAVTTNFAYEPMFNQLTATIDPLGHATSFTYDSGGNRIAVTDPLGNTTTFTYNVAGQPISSTDPLGVATQFAYELGDLVGITDSSGRTTSAFADSVGRLLSITDALGHIKKYSYNSLNQVTSATDALGNAVSFSYDANGNLTGVTDANNHTTIYTYNSMDHMVTGKDPLQNQVIYQYDPNGSLSQFTDRRGKVTTYSYDNLGRRTFIGFGMQAGPTYESTISYAFDAGNRLMHAVDSITGTITRSYDGFDRVTSEATPQGSVAYTYDLAGRRNSMTVAGQGAVNYSFDSANRLTQIAQGASAASFGYDAAGRRISLTLLNGVTMTYAYDSASQLAGISYQLGQNTLGNLSYSYDLAGRRVQEGGSFARTGLPQSISVTAYNAANQLTQWGTATPTYDANGNMLSDGTNSYTWDTRNHLVSLNMGAETFQYDPFGRRVLKSTLLGTTSYLYDGVNPIQELSGNNPTANLLAGGVDEFFQRTDSSGTANFLSDALGSTLALTDNSGASLAQYTYEPFGNTTITGASASPYQHTGRENDGTGLYFYRSRYYSPSFQRFVSEDPIGFFGGINLYAYVGNSPVNGRDPLGQWSPQGHDFMIRHALQPCGVSEQEIEQIQNGSREADSATGTGTDQTYIHSMTAPGENADQMVADRNGFVDDTLEVAQTMYRNDPGFSMNQLGWATHPGMDMTSPAHTDSGGNPIQWCGVLGCPGEGLSQVRLHSPDENSLEHMLNPGIENQDDIRSWDLALTDELIQTAYEFVTGQTLACRKQQ